MRPEDKSRKDSTTNPSKNPSSKEFDPRKQQKTGTGSSDRQSDKKQGPKW